MIGPRIGVTFGPRVGPAIGITVDQLWSGGGAPGVTEDATSGIYCPASSAEWATVLAAAGIASGGPSSLYLCQDAAGGAADSIGAIPLAQIGTLAYLTPVVGWTRSGISTLPGANALQSVAAGLPNIGVTSCLLLAYVLLPAFASTTRTVAQIGSAFGGSASAQLPLSIPKTMQFQLDPNVATGAVDNTNVVRPIIIEVNRTAGAGALSTDLENLAPALTGAPTGKMYMLGGDNSSSWTSDFFTFLYAARFDGAAAELTLAQRRSLLQTLNWSIPW